ncbi:MAG: conserved rane protein of unknown function [Pseudonocardia sp.]|nr:conserved rane protein of unknown function [Pseudonocardia sp.]
MTRLVRAEFRKLLTTRLWLWLLLGSIGLVALFTSLTLGFSGRPGNPAPPLDTAEGLRSLLSSVTGATALVAVLGVIAMTSEYRYLTITATFLATPRRERVVGAKLVTYAAVGLVFGVACALAVLVIALPWLAAKDVAVSGAGGTMIGTLAAGVAVLGIYGALGVGVGALVRNQVAAVVGLLVFLFVVQPLFVSIPALNPVGRLLPGSAAAAVMQVSQSGFEVLAPWQGAVVLLLYGLVLAGLGVVFTVRRDVT